MSDWQPIETAPKDGTRILIANRTHFTAAYWHTHEEPAMTLLGFGDPKDRIPAGGFHLDRKWSVEQVPNPKAGQRTYWWSQDNPVAFNGDDELGPDCDGVFESFEPTHWQPLPLPPSPATRKEGE
jgi:hypothetical protein